MKLLVTGVAGLYGLHTLEELVSRQDISKIYGIDDFSRGFPQEEEFGGYPRGEKFQLIRQRFQDITVKELNSLNIDVVIHLAGYNSTKESANTPEEYFSNNEYGTFRLIQTLLRTKNRPFLVYASGADVYENTSSGLTDEQGCTKPKNIYTATKLAAEHHIMAVGSWYDYPVVSMRFANTYGENQNIRGYTSVISSFIDRALRNEPLIIYGSGEQCRDFLYVKDAARALNLAVTHKEAVYGRIYNIATGVLTSITELAEKIIKMACSTSEIIKLPCETGEHGGVLLDTRAAQKKLAWQPCYSLDEGLRRTISWYRGLPNL